MSNKKNVARGPLGSRVLPNEQQFWQEYNVLVERLKVILESKTSGLKLDDDFSLYATVRNLLLSLGYNEQQCWKEYNILDEKLMAALENKNSGLESDDEFSLYAIIQNLLLNLGYDVDFACKYPSFSNKHPGLCHPTGPIMFESKFAVEPGCTCYIVGCKDSVWEVYKGTITSVISSIKTVDIPVEYRDSMEYVFYRKNLVVYVEGYGELTYFAEDTTTVGLQTVFFDYQDAKMKAEKYNQCRSIA